MNSRAFPRILGLLLFLVTLWSGSGCTSVQRTAIDESRYTAPIRLACVGDSITFGVGTKDRHTESYPAQLASLLGPKWDVRNFGNSGSTLLGKGNRPYVKQKQYAQALEYKPQVIVIKLGTNDSKPQNWDSHQTEFVADYEALLDRFASLDTKPVIFLCLPIPCFLPGNDSIREKVLVDEVAPKITTLAKARGLVVIDLHKTLEGRPELVPDRIHPNKEGAGLIARAVYSALTGRAPAKP